MPGFWAIVNWVLPTPALAFILISVVEGQECYIKKNSAKKKKKKKLK